MSHLEKPDGDPHAATKDRYLEEYDLSFAERWDRVVGWEARARREGTFYRDLLNAAGARRVLDAATGSGFHAILLAEAGFDVTATDGAPAMVDKARENVAQHDVDVRCEVSDWRDLASLDADAFDAVLCLGNSLSHLFDGDDLVETLETFNTVLVEGGTLILDQRNHDAILDGTAPPQGDRYCCTGADIVLDMTDARSLRITYTLDEGRSRHSIETCPWRRGEMLEALDAAGFGDIRTFGDFNEHFDPATAEFLVHVGRSPFRA